MNKAHSTAGFLVLLGVLIGRVQADQKEWFCVTGDSLEHVSLIVSKSKARQTAVELGIHEPSGESRQTKTFVDTAELQRMLAKGRLQLVFSTSSSNEYGGATSKALLFVLERQEKTPRKYTGVLAEEGTVYQLTCEDKSQP